MKTPITYYGGKQSMLKHILPLIPTLCGMSVPPLMIARIANEIKRQWF